MKNYIQQISKLFSLIFLSLVLSLSIISCDNFSKDSDNNQTILTQPEFSNGNKGIVKIKLLTAQLQKSRTALPEALSIGNFSDFQLKGEINGTAINLGSWYLPIDLECETFELEVGEWDLTLSATYNGYTYSDTKSINVTLSSVQQVDFVLSSDSISGGIILHLDFDTGKTVDHVSYELENYLTSTVIDSGNLTITNSEGINYVEYIKDYNDAIPSGTYRLSISFYGEADLLLNTYRELVRVKGGHQSSRYQFIDLNEVYTITYHNTEDATLVSGSLVEKYSINSDYSTIIFPDLSKPNYVFLGWYIEDDGGVQVTRLPDGSSGDQHFYARWQAYPKLSYKLVNYSNEVYDVSDTLRESYKLPALHNPTQATDLSNYEITDGTSPITCNFYYNSSCTNQITGGTIPAAGITADSVIYIKPTVTHVYVSPATGVDYAETAGSGNDQLPFDSRTPAQTVASAKKWLKNADFASAPVLYVMSSITEGVGDLSDLSLSSANGGLYGASIIKRYPSFTDGYLINMESGTANVTNLIIDGGADWRNSTDNTQPLADGSNVDEGINKGVTASAGLIKIQNGATLNMQNVSLRNNDCHNSSYTAKNIEIILGGVLDISQSTITRCKADLGGAIWSSGKIVANTITLSYNYATTNGGAVVAANSSNIMFKRSTFLSNNARDCGGAIYNMATSHQFYSVQNTFESNYAYSQGNIFYNTGNMTLGKETVIDGLFDNDSDIYIDNTNNYPIKFDSDFSITGTASNITINPYIYYSGTSSPVFDRQIFDFSALTSISTIKSKFKLSDSNYMIDDSGYIKPLPGTITVTPGFPENYICGYTMTKRGSNRKIKLSFKKPAVAPATEPEPLDTSLINSISVSLYETNALIKTWSGNAAADNIANALSFDYPNYIDDPTNTSFYVQVSIKPDEDSTVAYSYDFYAMCEGNIVAMSNISIPTGSEATFNGAERIADSAVFVYGRNLGQMKSLVVSDHEVTQGEYEKYMTYYGTARSLGTYKPLSGLGLGENYPVYNVTWYEAIIYCNLRSKAEGLTPAYYITINGNQETDIEKWVEATDSIIKTDSNGKYYYNSTGVCNPLDNTSSGIKYNEAADGWRLPTDVEWEYFAREGNLTNNGQKIYSGTDNVDELPDYAWFATNSGSTSHEVCTKEPNSLGLFDISGNVGEWCWDRCSNTSNSLSGTGANGPSTGSDRINRGGSSGTGADYCKVSYRNSSSPKVRGNNLGFRVVRTAD